MNMDAPTRVPSGAGRPTSPDLSIASLHIALDSEWSTLTTLNSDHLPILIQLGGAFLTTFPEPPHRTFMNFRRANWDSFQEETEVAFALTEPPTTCGSGEKVFRRILTTAGKHHIPSGHVPFMIPGLSTTAKRLIEERDELRSSSHSDPRILELNNRIQRDIDGTNRKIWIDKVEATSHKNNTSQFFSIIRSLNGRNATTPPNQPIQFGHSILTLNREIACAFNKQFANVVPHTSDPSARSIKRQLDNAHPLNPDASPFSSEIVQGAIRRSGNSRAAGPDGLTILHLKHLGPRGLAYLTHLYNLSYNGADIPAIWKEAIVIPLLKPGKVASMGPSYRPISLLSPAVKVMERLLLPEISRLPLAQSQHGFRPNRSTVTALLPLADRIAEGFNRPRPPFRTVTMALDLSKAFDVLDRIKLIVALAGSNLRSNTIRWLSTYLKGRMASCRYNQCMSPRRQTRSGVPQGSCLSPVLFNFFVSSYPQSDHISSTSYADDFNDSCSDPSIPAAAARLTDHATRVSSWAAERGMILSAPKSTVTLFTPDNHQHQEHPIVTLGGVALPLDRTPRILGVVFDTGFRFKYHIENLVTRAAPRINVLKALTGTSWGQQKETIEITYKSLIRSLFTYACPVWLPFTSNTNIQKLQVVQNSALRIATGCVRSTDLDHLHRETKILPVKNHLSLLSAQYLARALQAGHPAHDVVTRTPSPGDRGLRKTLRAFSGDRVGPHLVGGVIPADSLKTVITSLHTDEVTRTISAQSPNRVLGTLPPQVNAEELSLPRRSRTTLSQLRSDCCSSLNGYLGRIGAVLSDLCPSCLASPQNTRHIFECPSHPTPYVPEDLWKQPRGVSEFLSTLPFFSLAPVERPAPEPPPSADEA